jgi:hypothetical protein
MTNLPYAAGRTVQVIGWRAPSMEDRRGARATQQVVGT